VRMPSSSMTRRFAAVLQPMVLPFAVMG